MRKTKIICTLGPACDTEEQLKNMIQNGLDCARLNFSHGTHEEQKVRIDRGCIVNVIHIMQVKDSMAILKNGTSLPISRSHLQKVKEQINSYWGMHI